MSLFLSVCVFRVGIQRATKLGMSIDGHLAGNIGRYGHQGKDRRTKFKQYLLLLCDGGNGCCYSGHYAMVRLVVEPLSSGEVKAHVLEQYGIPSV